MTKSQLRRLIKDLILDKPKKKWEATIKIWDRAIWLGWGAILWITATFTNNVGILLFLIFMAILGLGILYFTAKGR